MKKAFILSVLMVVSLFAAAQEHQDAQVNRSGSTGIVGYEPSAENLKARSWFEEARFGLFIHWGVYSVLGDGEWVMNNQNISKKNYEKLPQLFHPTAFDARAWVQMAKDAGMKYITITSRHHDSFSMYDSKVTDYNIVDATPFKRDVLAELAEACREADIKLFFYYSLLDWNRDDYYPRGRTGTGIAGREPGNWDEYITFMKAQLTELLTNYGPIGGIWFDGHWDQMGWDGKEFSQLKVDWKYDELYRLIHELQPAALVGNNHHLGVIPGEDFQMFEKDLPGQNTTGWATAEDQIALNLPLEVCETINGSWGFNLQDENHKSNTELLHYLIKAAGYGSNLLLNVGPMPNGAIQEEHQASLSAMGAWMKQFGATIYGTQKGPLKPTDDYAITRKGDLLYLHVLNPQLEKIHFADFDGKIASIKAFEGGAALPYKNDRFGLVIDLAKAPAHEIDRIVEIRLR
jgi:alpha-L-fucosidase